MSRTPDANYSAEYTVGPIPAPRYATVWAALVCAVLTLALGLPALGGKFLVNPYSDQYIAGYAFREFGAAYLRTHHAFPQWNPYLFDGMPYVAAMHGDIFYPTFLLRMVLPTDVAMTWGFMIHVFLAGIFTYAFLRALGLSFKASLVGGVAYMMSGNVAGLVSPGHDGKLFISALLPMALLCVVRGVRDGRHWAWGALSLVIGLAVLSPHPQLLQYMLLRLAASLGAVALGLLIGAIQYLPVREYVGWSPRAGGIGWDAAVSYSLPPEEMLNFVVPQFTGMLDNYWGRNGIHFHSEYIGGAVFLLAGLAIGGWALRSQKRLVGFWLASFFVSLLWALGGNTPFYRLVYAVVPGTRFFRAPSVMLFMVSFCVAVLAAFGVERLALSQLRRRYLISWAIVAVLIGLLGASGGLTNLGVTIADQQRTGMVMANDGALRFGALRAMVFILLGVAGAWAVSARLVSRHLGTAILVAVVALDLWSVERRYWRFSEPASTLFATNEIIDFLRKQPQPVRVLSGQAAPSEVPHDPLLGYDGLMVHRIRQVLGYHGNHIGKVDLLIGGGEDGNREIASPNFWRLANLKYLVTNSPDPFPFPGIKRLLGPVKSPAGSDLYLHELPVDAPYSWITPVMVKAADDAVLGTVLDPRFDVRSVALFDTSAAVQGREISTPPAALPIKSTVTSYEAGRVSLELDAPAPEGAALVVSENYYPGWQATVDGKPAPVGRVDVALLGVVLPTGARKVELTYDSPVYHRGANLTLVALILTGLLWASGGVLDRRRGARG
jgi:Bacterial membrane protein YfhO